MSKVLIGQYLNNLADLKKLGDRRESVVREAFKDLLKGWGKAHDLIFVPEYAITTPAKDRRYVDGALLHELRMPFGYWEAKDEKDDLDAEIAHKFSRGYPSDNIIFEDSTEAVLIQNRTQVIRCEVDDVEKLEKLLNLFFGYQRTEIQQFNRAVQQFKTDLPAVLEALLGRAAWGEELMNLHIAYEKVAPAKLKRTDKVDEKLKDTGASPKVILKADKEVGRIALDSETSLSGIPAEAWDYRLGNRCALEWILDQYKEKKPKDPTIREKFNTYRFADYKEKVIDLLLRVTTVSVRTVEITRAMDKAARS